MGFLYTINAFGSNPVIQINKHIGFDKDDGQGIDGTILSRELFEINVLTPELITLYINTLGGDVQEGFDIFNAITSITSKTKNVIQGFAYSTGGWIALAADIVEAYDYSTWMCHLPYNPLDADMRSEFLDKVTNSVATIISQKSGRNANPKLSVDDVKQMMRVKTYYTAQDLYDKGLIDRVIPSGTNDIAFNKDGELKVRYREYQRVVNKEIENINYNPKTENIMAYEKVLNKLKLADGSGEGAIVEAIADMENKLFAVNKQVETLTGRERAANESKEKMEQLLKEAQNAHNEMTAMYNKSKESLDKLTGEHDAMNKEFASLKIDNEEAKKERREKEAENAKLVEDQRKEKATNLIKKFKDIGKIPEDAKSVANWEKMAYENYENTETILETLVTNVKIPRTENSVAEVDLSKTVFSAYGDGSDEAFRIANREKRKAK